MSQDDKVDCIFCHGTGKLAFSEETRKLAQRAVEAQRNDTRTMDEQIRDGVSFILGPDAPADPAQEGYPGIAHDLETMRSALVQIRDECFNGHAHDIAEAALNAAPQSEGTRDAGLPDAGRREPADAALSPGRPAAVAAPNSASAAQLAFDQQSDDPAPGDWNAACRHIADLLRRADRADVTK